MSLKDCTPQHLEAVLATCKAEQGRLSELANHYARRADKAELEELDPHDVRVLRGRAFIIRALADAQARAARQYRFLLYGEDVEETADAPRCEACDRVISDAESHRVDADGITFHTRCA